MTLNTPIAVEHDSGCRESRYYVLGGSHLGTAVARLLRADGHAVCVVDESYEESEPTGRRGDPADLGTLEEVGLGGASAVVVATDSDSRNLLIAQLVRAHFDVGTLVALVNVPGRMTPFVDAGHDTVCATTVLSEAIVGAL